MAARLQLLDELDALKSTPVAYFRAAFQDLEDTVRLKRLQQALRRVQRLRVESTVCNLRHAVLFVLSHLCKVFMIQGVDSIARYIKERKAKACTALQGPDASEPGLLQQADRTRASRHRPINLSMARPGRGAARPAMPDVLRFAGGAAAPARAILAPCHLPRWAHAFEHCWQFCIEWYLLPFPKYSLTCLSGTAWESGNIPA